MAPGALPQPCGAFSVSGLNNGDLVLKDISREDDGLYQCTVANHVGYSVCVVEVKVSGGCSGSGPGGPGAGRAGLEEPGLSALPSHFHQGREAVGGGWGTGISSSFLTGCPGAPTPDTRWDPRSLPHRGPAPHFLVRRHLPGCRKPDCLHLSPQTPGA